MDLPTATVAETPLPKPEGLEGVVAASTALSHVFGEEGRLVYRGYDIHELAGKASFEEVAHLLWIGHLPDRARRVQRPPRRQSRTAAGGPSSHSSAAPGNAADGCAAHRRVRGRADDA